MSGRLDAALTWAKDRATKRPVRRKHRPQVKHKNSTMPAYVYVMECQGFYKIGVAGSPKKRLTECQTGNPFEIKLLSSFPTDDPYGVERHIHGLLVSLHVRGEWFKLPSDIVDRLTLGLLAPTSPPERR